MEIASRSSRLFPVVTEASEIKWDSHTFRSSGPESVTVPLKLRVPFPRLILCRGKHTMWELDFSSTAEAVVGILLVAAMVAVILI